VALIAKRSIMTLFSKPACPECHRVRLVLAEKGINHEVIYIRDEDMPEDLLDLNPYQSVPTLVDRDLVLYDARVIMEYLDERFPHPPLMPVDPVSRAKFRLTMFRIEKEWYQLVEAMRVGREEAICEDARRLLRERLISSAEVFLAKPFFLSTEFSLVDCTIAPILWRLSNYEIDLPIQAKPILRYAERIFSRPGFKGSLSSLERAMC
jgi:RNA polymerase-associated protein